MKPPRIPRRTGWLAPAAVAALILLAAWPSPSDAVIHNLQAMDEHGQAVPNSKVVIQVDQGYAQSLKFDPNKWLVTVPQLGELFQLGQTPRSDYALPPGRETQESFGRWLSDFQPRVDPKAQIPAQDLTRNIGDLGGQHPAFDYYRDQKWSLQVGLRYAYGGAGYRPSTQSSGGSPLVDRADGQGNYKFDTMVGTGLGWPQPGAGSGHRCTLGLACEGAIRTIPSTQPASSYRFMYGEACEICLHYGSKFLREPNSCFMTALPAGIYQVQSAAPPPDMASQWAFKKLGLPLQVPRGRLAPVTVAVIDTGLDYRHPVIQPENLWANPRPGSDPEYPDDVIGWNFIEDHNNPWDDNGHGTFVAGLILAINPAARIMPLKAMGTFGDGLNSAISRAILYAVEHGARVINVSVGAKGLSAVQQEVVDYARGQGALVIVAAGNEGIDTSGYSPAGVRGVITVSATDQNDKKPPFGNWGQNVALAAPGVDIVSLRARGTDFVLVASEGKDYKAGANFVGRDRWLYRATGTSFSAPLVSGAAALLLSLYPNLTPGQVERMLVESADDIEVPGWDQFTGAGRLNIARALFSNPNDFLTARVSAIQPVQARGQTLIRISGTASGNRLASFQIQLGQGDSPTGWKTVVTEKGKNVEGAVLAEIPVKEITARGKWTVRLVVQDSSGKTREARGTLDVQ